MSVTGPPGSGPWRAGIAIADSAAGTFLAQGILAALVARASSGRGQWVHTSLLEALVNLMDFQAERWLVERDVPGQAGNDHPSIPGSGTFRTADGYVNVVAIAATDRFYAAIGRPDLADDEHVARASTARERRDAVYAACEEIFRERSSAEWVELLNAADIACGPVLAMDEVFADPQVRHLQLTRAVAHPTAGALDLLRLPLTFSDATVDVGHAAPAPGAHTREVLAEHGYSEPEVEELVARGVAREAG